MSNDYMRPGIFAKPVAKRLNAEWLESAKRSGRKLGYPEDVIDMMAPLICEMMGFHIADEDMVEWPPQGNEGRS